MAGEVRQHASACDILVGARGWEHSSWRGGFYPDDLPRDWRLSYYANAFRAVLVPAERLGEASAGEVAQWREEVPEGFRFFLEVSGGLIETLRGDVSDFLAYTGAIGDTVGGIVLDLESAPLPAAAGLGGWLEQLAGQFTLGARWRGGPLAAEAGTLLDAHGVGRCWRSGDEEHAVGVQACCGFLRAPVQDIRRLREQVESFMAWSASCGQAFLCFEGDPGIYGEMEQARVIAELLTG